MDGSPPTHYRRTRACDRAGPTGSPLDLDRNTCEAKAFAKDPKADDRRGLERLDKMTDARIVAWRVATTGGLAELGAVEWRVGKNVS